MRIQNVGVNKLQIKKKRTKMSRADLKVVLLGHEAVGKTSLMQRFVSDRFNDAYQNVSITPLFTFSLTIMEFPLLSE